MEAGNCKKSGKYMMFKIYNELQMSYCSFQSRQSEGQLKNTQLREWSKLFPILLLLSYMTQLQQCKSTSCALACWTWRLRPNLFSGDLCLTMLVTYLKLSAKSLKDAFPKAAWLREHLHDVADVRRRCMHEMCVVVDALRHHAATRWPGTNIITG